MRKWLIGAMCAAMIVTVPKGAKSFENGHDLLEFAISENLGFRTSYYMYVAGIERGISLALDVLQMDPFYCIGHKITIEDSGDVVRVWLRRNPQHLGLESQIVVMAALAAQFPCEARSQ